MKAKTVSCFLSKVRQVARFKKEEPKLSQNYLASTMQTAASQRKELNERQYFIAIMKHCPALFHKLHFCNKLAGAKDRKFSLILSGFFY